MVIKGMWFHHPNGGGEVKVMAVDSGYCMCRRPRMMPFIMSTKDVEPLVAAYALEQQNLAIARRSESKGADQ